MVVIGVDTSLRSTGFGVIETAGNRIVALEAGRVRNASDLPLTQCLVAIHEKISSLIALHRPDVMAVEGVIYAKNANTMLALGQARGAVLLAAAENKLPVYDYEPRRVKMSVCGNGLAEKEQVQRMVKTLLSLDKLPQNDAADALAIAICHAHSNLRLLQKAPL
ncbi:MAG: crossover junction endodeoxyribonuclease RuvC [Kiritimatiellae bacterium]|nr:crossover junction endodeoxyribonuclease RuvC [Kiritimatiellia bacterium]